MKIRLASEKDRVGVYETIGYCFSSPLSAIKNNIENGPLNTYEQFIVALNDEEKVESVVSVVPFDVYFEGKVVKFGGIAGVSSLPEYRSSGNISNLMSFSLNYMKEHNMILSGLGPFAFQYYRKFGYEWCYTWQLVSINIEDLKNYPSATSYKELRRENTQEFENFRNKIISKMNGPVVRDQRIINEKWDYYEANNCRVYGAFENDKMVSMMVYNTQGRELKVSEIYFENETARQYLLNFLYRHRSMSDKVELVLTTDDEIRNILPTPRLNYWHWPNKMGRVVMVKEALELLNIEDKISGSLNIKVLDPHANWNNQTFNIQVKKNHLNVTTTSDSADFEISIQRLSQLILGHMDGKEALKLETLKVYNEDKVSLFKKLFTKRTTMLWQEF